MSLRFGVDTLRLLIEFKMSEDRFPSKQLMNLFGDLLPVDGLGCLYTFISEASYEYFYSGKSTNTPSRDEYTTWVSSWCVSVGARRLKIDLSRNTPKKASSTEETEHIHRPMHFIVVDSKEIAKNSPSHRARKRLLEEIKETQKSSHPEIKRVRFSASEDILKCTEKEPSKPPVKTRTGNNLLSFITKKYEKCEETSSRIPMRQAGVFQGRIATARHCKEIAKPVRMVFYQMHGQVRPPFYGIKACRDASKLRNRSRDSTKKILAPEEYMYDSDEEWIEEDGESIDEDSTESMEEESEDAEWVEKDTDEIFFSKGQLPRMDHPEFTVVLVDEAKAE